MKSETSPPSSTEAGSGTVSRVVQLLGLLADAQGNVTVKYVAQRMKLAPSTAHRLLHLLKAEGFVQAVAESRQYAVGPRFYRVASRVVEGGSVAARAQPVIDAIARHFDETVLFGLYLPTECALSFAGRADGEQKLKYQIDMHIPLSLVWGASGKVILACLPEDAVLAILATEGQSPATGEAPPPWDALRAELALIRERGWAVTYGEKLPDARGIAAPVFGAGGVVGSICLTSPKARMPHASIEAIGRDIASHAGALSHDLGAALP